MTDMDEEIAIKHLDYLVQGTKWRKNYSSPIGSQFVVTTSKKAETVMKLLRRSKIPYSKSVTDRWNNDTTFSVKISDVLKEMEPVIYTANKLGIL